MQPYYMSLTTEERCNNFPNQFTGRNQVKENFKIPDNFRILVVDDDEDFLEALSFTLRKKEIDVIAVESGYDAVNAVVKNGFDLILLDLKMPGMDGLETFKKINEIKSKYLVILMTAFHEKEQTSELKKSGAFGFLKKPFEFDQLLEYILKTRERNNDN